MTKFVLITYFQLVLWGNVAARCNGPADGGEGGRGLLGQGLGDNTGGGDGHDDGDGHGDGCDLGDNPDVMMVTLIRQIDGDG